MVLSTLIVQMSFEKFLYRSVTRGAERLRHALFRPRQDVTAGSHRPSDQHRLTCELETTPGQISSSTFKPRINDLICTW